MNLQKCSKHGSLTLYGMMQLQVYLRLSCPSGLETEQLVNFIKRKDHKMVFKLSQKSLDKLNGVFRLTWENCWGGIEAG